MHGDASCSSQAGWAQRRLEQQLGLVLPQTPADSEASLAALLFLARSKV